MQLMSVKDDGHNLGRRTATAGDVDWTSQERDAGGLDIKVQPCCVAALLVYVSPLRVLQTFALGRCKHRVREALSLRYRETEAG